MQEEGQKADVTRRRPPLHDSGCKIMLSSNSRWKWYQSNFITICMCKGHHVDGVYGVSILMIIKGFVLQEQWTLQHSADLV